MLYWIRGDKEKGDVKQKKFNDFDDVYACIL